MSRLIIHHQGLFPHQPLDAKPWLQLLKLNNNHNLSNCISIIQDKVIDSEKYNTGGTHLKVQKIVIKCNTTFRIQAKPHMLLIKIELRKKLDIK